MIRLPCIKCCIVIARSNVCLESVSLLHGHGRGTWHHPEKLWRTWCFCSRTRKTSQCLFFENPHYTFFFKPKVTNVTRSIRLSSLVSPAWLWSLPTVIELHCNSLPYILIFLMRLDVGAVGVECRHVVARHVQATRDQHMPLFKDLYAYHLLRLYLINFSSSFRSHLKLFSTKRSKIKQLHL